MESAVGIFGNGITGVFIGMAILYLAIKLIAVLFAPRKGTEETE